MNFEHGKSSGLPLEVLQAAFYVHILGQDTESKFESHIHPDEIGAAERTQIHKNNFFITLTEALKEIYPVLRRLVGDDYFEHVAHEYVYSNPPKSGCLVEFGEDFPSFVSVRPEVQKLLYLRDVGRFEWLINEAFHEADAKPVDKSDLESFLQDSYGELRFQFHPSSRLFYSPYPVHKIWQANLQDNTPQEISLDDGPCWSFIVRPELDVEVRHLHKADFKFLNSLYDHKKLGKAIEDAQKVGEDFNPQQTLTDFIDVVTAVNI